MSGKKFARVKLGSLLNLVVGAVFIFVAVLVVALVNHQTHRQTLTEAKSKDILVLNRNMAIHTYFTRQLKPRLFEWTEPLQGEGYFDPTWMSSTYAVREMDKYFKSLSLDSTDYYYKESAVNARSPENEADAYERAFIEELNANPELEERSAIRNLDGKPYFVTLRRGEMMEETCLRCHSTPDQAPGGLIDVYGPGRSFGREVGQAVSAISIRTPLATAYAEADRFSLRLSGVLLALLLGLFAVQFWLNKRLLFAPLAQIRDKALQISSGGEHLGEEIRLPWGRELSDLTTAFNAMSVSLRRNVDQLEERVAERTAELQRLNARLEEIIEERTRELQDAQEQLVRREKLAVLGQLSGSIAHELRNPLATIKNTSYLLNMVLEEPEPEIKKTLEILEREVASSEKIINNLLDFARTRPPTRQQVDVNHVVQEALSRVTAPENVEVTTQLDEALPPLLADPDQLGQVFGNLILNAVQAMTPPSSTGTPQGGRLNIQSLVSSSKWVSVSVSDTGAGIPQENLDQIFEPLFTTKTKGIGLGLAIVKNLVEGHGGRIEVQSEVEKGSTFTVRLPVSGEPIPTGG